MRTPLVITLAAVAVVAGTASVATGRPAVACADDNAGLVLPAGFCATLFAEGLPQPRHGVVAPSGELLVNSRSGGGVVLLKDADGDGRAEISRKIADANGTGVALGQNTLYATAGSAIIRYPLRPGTLEVAGPADTIVRDLPMGGHSAHNFVLDGRTLYVNVGSRTNSCQEKDRQTESRGIDPCVELDGRAGIWAFDATKTNQTVTLATRYATGIRNAVALTRNPKDGSLWAMQHGRDQLAQNWGRLFDNAFSAENPGEELLQIKKGDDFGWPYCFSLTTEKKKVLAPEYGGDGKEVGRCAQKKAAVYLFPGHWAPNATLFYTGTQFPAAYRNGVFVAFHGSWNRAPLPQAGFQVAFLPLNGTSAAGSHQTFADGFVKTGAGARQARPTGLAQGADGSMYVMDDAGGRVFRIAYRGN
jgi:glucose/arabinose dehydrogenase